MLIRYLLLSPSAELRRTFIGNLFGGFEASPQGRGERRRLEAGDDGLEVVGAGEPGRLVAVLRRLVEGGVRIDGALVLIESGDEDGWREYQEMARWVPSLGRPLPLRAWVLAAGSEVDREGARRSLLDLMDEHARALGPP